MEIGGLRWYPDNSPYTFDICLLSDFVLIAKYRLAPLWQSLLICIDFTMNAVIYDFIRKSLYERNCISDIRRSLLEFNTRRMAGKLLLAYRILLIRHKTGFALSPQVFSFIKTQIDLNTLVGRSLKKKPLTRSFSGLKIRATG